MPRLDRRSSRPSFRLLLRRLPLSTPPLRRTLLLGLLLGIVSLGAACDKGPARECDSRVPCPGPLVCDEGSNQCVDPSDGTFCTADENCTTAEKPFCSPASFLCVPCIEEDLAKRCADGRVCRKTTCGGCEEDSECLGDTFDDDTICLRTLACAPKANVAYVSATGTDNTTCTFEEPCTSLANALATNRPYIRLRGDFQLTAPLAISRAVTIHGSKEIRTTITRTGTGEIFDMSGSGTVELRDLQISGATGDGIRVSSGSPKLDLDNVDVIGNSGVGISSGMAALKVTRSLIVGNAGGGIAAAAAVVLENNIITGNGSATSTVGGLQLASTDAGNVVRFNTFGGNNATGTVTGRSVSCGAATVRLSSNIFADASPQVLNCTTTYSLFSMTPPATGLMDKMGDPKFVTTTLTPSSKVPPSRADFTYYHIQEDSPAQGAGEVLDTGIGDDFDGDPRGKDGKEIGADELN